MYIPDLKITIHPILLSTHNAFASPKLQRCADTKNCIIIEVSFKTAEFYRRLIYLLLIRAPEVIVNDSACLSVFINA